MRVNRILQADVAVNAAPRPVIDLSLMDALIAKYKGKKGNLIPLLQGVQHLYGFVPAEAFEKLADETGHALSDMYGVATFYAQFRLKPVGKNVIKVCHGTACHVQNASKVTVAIAEVLGVEDGETTPDGFFTLESVACLGCCSLAPVMMIGDDTYGKLDAKAAVKVIKDMKRLAK
ncbi:MAG: NADP-reducing hydrogenase subunit HndA [Bacteroidota bacterium]